MNDPLLKALANTRVTFQLQSLFRFSKHDNASVFSSHGSEMGLDLLIRDILNLEHLTWVGLYRFLLYVLLGSNWP